MQSNKVDIFYGLYGRIKMTQGKVHPNLLIQFATIIIYLVFTCSVVYNYAYFLALNISIAQMPLAISEYYWGFRYR